MNNKPIGVFDSGVGGLAILRELRRQMPGEDIIFFGDTGRFPYGTRSKETILKYTRQIVSFLMKHDVKAIIAACGTISSLLPDNKAEQSVGITVPFTGVVMPTTRTACSMTSGGRIGVIATSSSIRTGAFGRAVRSISPSAKVFGNACPLLAPIVESGFTDKNNPIARSALEIYLAPLIREEIDTLILGCTHYRLLYDTINDILEYKVTLIDPGDSTAREFYKELLKLDLLSGDEAPGSVSYYITDSYAVETFGAIAKPFLQEEVSGSVTYVPVEELGA